MSFVLNSTFNLSCHLEEPREWYGNLSKDRLVATPEIAAKAQELDAGKTDFYEKTEAIAEFVQKQVRYFAIEVGVGGYQPHAAGDVFRHRYGDCKDKATLVSAMLSTVGIHAALMMVDSERGVIDPNAPSLVGNHMIAAIEIPAGYNSPRLHTVVTASSGRRYLIFDPTWDKTAFGQLEHELQGSYGILLEGAETQAVQLPLLDPTLNTVRRTATFRLDSNGVLKGTVTEKRFGNLSEVRRAVYATGDAKEQMDFLDRNLGHDFTTFTTSDIKVDNVASLNKDFTLTYALSADRYAKSMGPLLMVRPRVLGSLALDTDHKERTVPINLDETMQATDEYSIELPDGYVVDEMPDPVKLDLGFAAYQSALEVKGHTLHYTRTFTVRQVTLPADRYADVQKLASVKVNSIKQLEDYEQPLVVVFDVKGQIASSTGKRLLVPSDLFEANEKPTFPHEKREVPVYFEYPQSVLDAVRITFPASLGLESTPAAEQLSLPNGAAYGLAIDSTPTSVTTHRTFLLGGILFPLDQYAKLRAFYDQFETKDQEPTVLKAAAPASGN